MNKVVYSSANVLCRERSGDGTERDLYRNSGQVRKRAQMIYCHSRDMDNANEIAPQNSAPDPQVAGTLSDGTKVKVRLMRMRACNEKDAKGKLCAGHLKRWYFFGEEVKQRFGTEAEIYRCERCKTLYLPNPNEEPRTGTLAW